jgi:hypothetical protein
MLPLCWTNRARGSDTDLYAAAYRITRDHLLRVRLSPSAGSAVHRRTAAKASSRSETFNCCKRSARRTRSISRPRGQPPRHEVIHGVQVPIDRLPVPAGPAVFPNTAEPFQVLAQGFGRMRDCFLLPKGLGGNVRAECNCMGLAIHLKSVFSALSPEAQGLFIRRRVRQYPVDSESQPLHGGGRSWPSRRCPPPSCSN